MRPYAMTEIKHIHISLTTTTESSSLARLGGAFHLFLFMSLAYSVLLFPPPPAGNLSNTGLNAIHGGHCGEVSMSVGLGTAVTPDS